MKPEEINSFLQMVISFELMVGPLWSTFSKEDKVDIFLAYQQLVDTLYYFPNFDYFDMFLNSNFNYPLQATMDFKKVGR